VNFFLKKLKLTLLGPQKIMPKECIVTYIHRYCTPETLFEIMLYPRIYKKDKFRIYNAYILSQICLKLRCTLEYRKRTNYPSISPIYCHKFLFFSIDRNIMSFVTSHAYTGRAYLFPIFWNFLKLKSTNFIFKEKGHIDAQVCKFMNICVYLRKLVIMYGAKFVNSDLHR
jgi:hypothetical protein